MATDDFDPTKFASLRLFHHVTEKGWQGGSLLGLVIGVPIMAYRAKPMVFLEALRNPTVVSKAAAYGAVTGAALSGAIGMARMTSLDADGIQDRVYRLHYNEGQRRTDTFAEVGMALGAAAAAALLGPAPLHVLGGAAMGTAGGLLAHMATRPVDKTPNKMIHEIKTT